MKMPRCDDHLSVDMDTAVRDYGCSLEPVRASLKLHVHHHLDTGSEGIVFFATDKLGKECAVKVCDRTRKAPNAKGEEMHWAKLNNPRCVKLLKLACEGNFVYYVMPYFGNGTLHDWLLNMYILRHRGAFDSHPRVPDVVFQTWTRDILKGIEFLQRMGFYHLDVKPDNIYVSDRWDLKVGDFGFLRSANDRTLPVLVGCPGYMPPEALKDNLSLDKVCLDKVDVWSVGAVLYELMTGRSVAGTDFALVTMEVKKLHSNLKTNLAVVKKESPRYPGGHRFALSLLKWHPSHRPSVKAALEDEWLMQRDGSKSVVTDEGRRTWEKLYYTGRGDKYDKYFTYYMKILDDTLLPSVPPPPALNKNGDSTRGKKRPHSPPLQGGNLPGNKKKKVKGALPIPSPSPPKGKQNAGTNRCKLNLTTSNMWR